MAQILERFFKKTPDHNTSESPRISPDRPLTVDELLKDYEAGMDLTAGQMAKILHVIKDPLAVERHRNEIYAKQAAFWKTWGPFRGMPAGSVDEKGKRIPTFEEVMKLLGVRDEYAKKVFPKRDQIFIDLMGGSGQMLQPLMNALRKNDPAAQLGGYICVDGNPENVDRATSAIKSSSVPGFAIQHDLGTGTLPEELSREIAQHDPQAVRFMSTWGISYFDMERLAQLLSECDALVPGCSVDVLMLTAGKFDPAVMKKNFMRQVVPQQLIAGNVKGLQRAFRALPEMGEFGRQLGDVVPLWTTKEFSDELQQFGYNVDVIDESLLWGQCSAVRVCASSPSLSLQTETY